MQKIKDKSFNKDIIYDISNIFDSEEKETKLSSIAINSKIDSSQSLSSGVLSVDLLFGGGLSSGHWYEICGEESSGKSTLMYSVFSSALTTIPNQIKGVLLDIEGVLDPIWFGNITGINKLDKVFGVRDEKTADWVKKPQIRYYKPAFGEMGLKFIKKILKKMPDKVIINDIWHYMFVPKQTKAGKKEDPTGGAQQLQSRLKNMYNKKLWTKTGNFFVPIPNNYSGPELLIGIDSIIAMTPEAISEDDSDAMSPFARMFAKHLNDIKSLISKKGAIMVALNQIREKPLAWGNPIYTPGGNTLKHVVDVRLLLKTISTPPPGKGSVDIEDDDEYRWCKAQTIKNKLFVPFKQTMFRWWTSHKGHIGYGPDHFVDLLNYLEATGQMEKKSNDELKINTKIFSKKIDRSSFKEIVLKDDKIFSFFKNQMSNGKGIKLYIENLKENK